VGFAQHTVPFLVIQQVKLVLLLTQPEAEVRSVLLVFAWSILYVNPAMLWSALVMPPTARTSYPVRLSVGHVKVKYLTAGGVGTAEALPAAHAPM
jgi:hypothetical protein